MLTGPEVPAVVIDLLFLPALALSIGMPIVRSRNWRNLKLLLVLFGLMLTNMIFHLAQLNILDAEFARLSLIAAIDIIVILIAVMAGRVILAFTANAIATAKPRQISGVEFIALGTLVLVLAADVFAHWFVISQTLQLVLFSSAAVAHLLRLALWQPLAARHQFLLLMLPIAYAWIPTMLALRAIAIMMPAVTTTTALHAMTIGAMASMMMAMMSRSALGHTGRTLRAKAPEIGAFVLLQGAVIARILPGLFWPAHYQTLVIASALLWCLAFGVFLVGYWPILTRPRVDGKPG
jgi:uncharacterized protein involved in response to NO